MNIFHNSRKCFTKKRIFTLNTQSNFRIYTDAQRGEQITLCLRTSFLRFSRKITFFFFDLVSDYTALKAGIFHPFYFFLHNNYSPLRQTVLFNKLCRNQGLKRRYCRHITLLLLFICICIFLIFLLFSTLLFIKLEKCVHKKSYKLQ